MKILLATYWSIPHLGGVWNYMVQLREKLETLGHQVDLLGYDEDNTSVYIVNENRKIERSKLLPLLTANLDKETYPEIYANQLVKYTEFQRYIYELSAAYFGLEKYDVIHTQDVIATTAIDRVRPTHVPLVATLHGSVAHSIRHQLDTIHQSDTAFMAKIYFDELERLGATAGDVTIVANHWLKNCLIDEFQVPANQINVLHYGFDTKKFIEQSKKKINIIRPKDKKVILYSGRLVDLKGVQHLITALSLIKKNRSDWVCWIVGSGNFQPSLIAQSIQLGLDDDILFFGKSSDVPALIAMADIVVLPSLLENQPLTIIEAQIAGKAVVVSDTGGLPEMVQDGVTGLVAPAGNAKSLATKIHMLLADEQLLSRLGHTAKTWGMAHWSIDRGVRDLLTLYHVATEKRRKADHHG